MSTLAYLTYIFCEVDKVPDHRLASWWRLFQWTIHMALVSFVLGTILFGYCNALVVRVLFVDHDVLKNGDKDGNSGCWSRVQDAQWFAVGWLIAFSIIVFTMVVVWKNTVQVAPSDNVELTAKEPEEVAAGDSTAMRT